MSKMIKLKNGVRLSLHSMKGTRSVSIGVFVGAGSAYENHKNSGISHFIEHMFFKGTNTRSAYDIANEMESLGAQINAFTSRELTGFYTLSTDEHAEKCMEILSDLFFNSTFCNENMEKEKGVVIEEINMCEDDPSDLCHELLSYAYFGDSGLGRNILGTIESVSSFTREDLLEYIKEYYTADNVVIAMAGNIKAQTAVELCEKYFSNFTNLKKTGTSKYNVKRKSRYVFKLKQIEQANIAFGFPAYKNGHELITALSIVSNVVGGGMSSRLFQKLREELGIVYDVYTMPSVYKKDGYFIIYLATNPHTVEKAIEAVRDVICEVKANGISETEFTKGKEQMKAALVLGAERSVSIMKAAGARAIMENKKFNINESLKRIDNVTMDDINKVIEHILDFDKVSAGYVGKEKVENVLEMIRCNNE